MLVSCSPLHVEKGQKGTKPHSLLSTMSWERAQRCSWLLHKATRAVPSQQMWDRSIGERSASSPYAQHTCPATPCVSCSRIPCRTGKEGHWCPRALSVPAQNKMRWWPWQHSCGHVVVEGHFHRQGWRTASAPADIAHETSVRLFPQRRPGQSLAEQSPLDFRVQPLHPQTPRADFTSNIHRRYTTTI